MVGEERIELSLLTKHDFELYASTITPCFIKQILCFFLVYDKCTNNMFLKDLFDTFNLCQIIII